MDDTRLDQLDDFADLESTIDSYISTNIITTEPTTSLRAAAGLLNDAGVGCIVIGTPSLVEGVVSERDIVRAVARGVDLDTTTVADVETKALKWATPTSTVADVAEEMMTNYVRHVMVGEDKMLVGVVSMRDLLAAYLD